MLLDQENLYFLPLRSGWDSELSWSFSTEIQTLFNGDEERISLRPIPWEKISYKYTFPDGDSKKIKPFLMNNLRDDYVVPLYYLGANVEFWSEAWVVDGVTISGILVDAIKTGIAPSGTSYQYDVMKYDSYIVLCKGYDVVVKKVFPIDGAVNNDGKVTVGFVSDGVNYTGWKVYPARIGKITNNPEIETNKKYSIVSIEYEIYDPIEFYEQQTTDKYNGIDIYRKCLLLTGDTLGFTHIKDIDASSNSLGIRKYFSDWDFSYRSYDLRKVIKNRSEFIEFLRWTMTRLGRYSPFWCPAYTTDFEFLQAGVNSISVENGDKRLKNFAIYRDDGSFYIRTANSVTVSGSTVNYIFSQNFESVPKKVFYAMLMRLTDDNVTFDFANGGMIVESSISVRSII